ncbi:MAG: tetratricopeptide repeat protein [Chloroflexota bacterium]
MPDVDPNKTVYISQRPNASRYLARRIFEDLRGHGYDVFLDVEPIDSEDGTVMMLHQIMARTHFLLILTPGTLDRCSEPNDRLRQEIERAIESGRNLVPLLVDEFHFGMAARFLTGKLADLPHYDAMRLPHDLFNSTMDTLRNRLSNTTALPLLHPIPTAEQSRVERAIRKAANMPQPTSTQLSAERFFTRAIGQQGSGNLDKAIADYSEAIGQNPTYAEAYGNRGNVYFAKGDLDAALTDYNQVLQLDPTVALGYYNRGIARSYKGDVDGAIADYSEAIGLKPDYAEAYTNRGIARGYKGDMDGAIADYNQVIRLKPEYASAYSNIGEVYFAQAQYDKALQSFKKADDLRPGYPFAQAGLAITQHALGKGDEARRLWMGLVTQDERYTDVAWVRSTLGWSGLLIEAAQKIIDGLE